MSDGRYGQFSIHPDVIAADVAACIGGPADGERFQCPSDRWLYVIEDDGGPRVVSLPPNFGPVARGINTDGYKGYYEPVGDELHWRDGA